jgi:hypothetical protein
MTDSNLNNIQVNVQTRYIEDQSNPEKNYYIFAYTITIVNQGQQPAKLLTRHWVITDSNHKVQEVSKHFLDNFDERSYLSMELNQLNKSPKQAADIDGVQVFKFEIDVLRNIRKFSEGQLLLW